MSLKVGLALGGGGARGIAHIAFINALEELDIKPDIIAGTGVGALVGGLYASGKSPADIVELLEEIDYRKSMKILNNYSFKDGKYGVLDHIGLEEYLELVMPVKLFDRLYTPLKVVAANYETKEEHIFDDGNVVSAIRASIAIPGIFSPVEVDEEFFIDGGCVNPLPIDVIKDECDVLIAVDVTGKGLDSEISVASTANDLAQCYQILTKMLLQEKSKNTKIDILAAPELDSVQMLDVFNFENIIEAVEEEVEDFKYEVAKLLKPELLEKAGTKPKKSKAEKVVEEEVELEEEAVEEEYEEEAIEEEYDEQDLESEEEYEEEYDESEEYDEEEYDDEEYGDDEYDEDEYDDEEVEIEDENAEIAAQIAALEAKLKEAQTEEKKSPKAKKQLGSRAKAKPAPKKQAKAKEEKPMSKRQAKRMAKKEALARLEQEILDELESR